MGNLMSYREPKRDPAYEWDRPYVREIAFSEFQDSAMAALSAEARYNWMKNGSAIDNGKYGNYLERKHAGLRHYNELIVTILLHLSAQIIQFFLIIYFVVGFIMPVQISFNPAHLQNNTYILNKTIAAHNHLMVPPWLQGLCQMNQSFTWLHRVMMFILMVKVIPEFGNSLWILYRMWAVESIGNHDIAEREEKEEYWLYEWKDKDLLAKDIKTHHADHTKRAMRWMTWRDEDLCKKDWKMNVLLLDVAGNMKKVSKVDEFSQDDYPIMWISQQVDEVHNIGKFSIIWKLFATCFIAVPQVLFNLYILAIGSQMIAYSGAPAKLVKLALKVKFLLKVPEVVFDGYASRDLKAYLEGACYTIVEDTQPVRPDPWATYLGPITKIMTGLLFAYAIYEWFFHDIIAFRMKCSEYFETFEGMIAVPEALLSPW